jgi:hypothetical protein
MTVTNPSPKPLSLRHVAQTWWPLAASWVLMGAELPALSAIVARLAEPKIHLAAYGGVVFPLALLIESPIIMLLAASTALSKDWDSYLKLRRFTMRAGALLTALHVLIAFTPGLGTALRLSVDGIVLAIGFLLGNIPGIVVATGTVAAGVISEAIYVGICVRPVLHNQLKQASPIDTPLTFPDMIAFYFPLAMTSLLNLLVQPIGSAALSRMPQPLESLAVWPVVSGLIFMHRSLGIAYNEVVVALLDEPRSTPSLRRFTTYLTVITTLLLLTIAGTPLSAIWFERVSALNPSLAALARLSLWIALPIPGLNVLQSWYQGAIVHNRRTRAVSEAVGIFLLISSALLWAGVAWGQVTGLYIGMVAFGAGSLAQTGWLWYRGRPVMRRLQARDADSLPLQVISSPIGSK